MNSKVGLTDRLARFVLILTAVAASSWLLIHYPNWTAERAARAFCTGVRPGADMSAIIHQFEIDVGFERSPNSKVSVRHYGFPDPGFAKDSHTFVFPGFMLDKAECIIGVDKDGKATSMKHIEMLYD